MIDDTTQTTLRDTIASAVESVEANQSTQHTNTDKALVNEAPVLVKDSKVNAGPDKGRDDQGRFTKPNTGSNVVNADAKAEKVRPQRPSSWKKDYWDQWDKLDPSLAEYLSQREQEYAKGVSTYKSEWDNAKPLVEAMAQFNPLLQEWNIKPSDWITNLGRAHQLLVQGTPEQKLSMFTKLIQDYEIPLQHLISQDQDGRVQINPQIKQFTAQPPQTDMRQVVKELLAEEAANSQVQQFAKSEQFPHFEQVRETMAGLLRAGLVEDLDGAYNAALNMPKHKELYDSFIAQQKEKEATKQRDEAQRQAETARAKALSPKSSTPAGNMKTDQGKGLRSTIEDAVNRVSGRV